MNISPPPPFYIPRPLLHALSTQGVVKVPKKSKAKKVMPRWPSSAHSSCGSCTVLWAFPHEPHGRSSEDTTARDCHLKYAEARPFGPYAMNLPFILSLLLFAFSGVRHGRQWNNRQAGDAKHVSRSLWVLPNPSSGHSLSPAPGSLTMPGSTTTSTLAPFPLL